MTSPVPKQEVSTSERSPQTQQSSEQENSVQNTVSDDLTEMMMELATALSETRDAAKNLASTRSQENCESSKDEGIETQAMDI